MQVVTELPQRIRCVENLWIPVPDGVRLAARLWLPDNAEAEPVPAIIECVPYRKRDGLRVRDEELHSYFAGHGYACLRIDLRGTGESEGLPDDEYTPAGSTRYRARSIPAPGRPSAVSKTCVVSRPIRPLPLLASPPVPQVLPNPLQMQKP